MKRRDFLTLAATVAAFPRLAFAQQTAKVPRVALLAVTMPPETVPTIQQGLLDFGYVDGKNITVQVYTASTYTDLNPLIADAVAGKPDLILTWGIVAAQSARQLTSTVPIVFTDANGDPLDSGLIASWSHPGGNVTGNTKLAPDVVGKQLGILREVLPTAKRVAVLAVPSNPVTQANVDEAVNAANALGIEPVAVGFLDTQDIGPQFDRVVAAHPDAVYVPSNSYFTVGRDAIFDLLVRNKLPAVSSNFQPGTSTPFVGVVAYAASDSASLRRSGFYVDAILKGAKPGDLPVEQATIFDFAVNLDAAKKIGIATPPDILAQATLVIDYDIRAPKAGAK